MIPHNTLREELREILDNLLSGAYSGTPTKPAVGIDEATKELLSAIKNRLPKERDENLYGISEGMTEPVPMDSDPEAEGYNIALRDVKQALDIESES